MKKIIQTIMLFVLVLVSNIVYGQNNMEDVVYLKNGSIIRGLIIEQVPNQSIKIQTKDRNVFVFKYDEIERMTKENLPTENSTIDSKVTDFKKNGFINLTELISAQELVQLKRAIERLTRIIFLLVLERLMVINLTNIYH